MSLEIKVPTVGESISEVTLSQWLKQDGDYVEMDETIAELESDKATFELPAEKAGILRTIAQEGDTLEIGAVVATIEAGEATAATEQAKANGSEKETASQTESEPAAQTDSTGSTNYAAGTASPAAAKILREKNVDPASVKGTGKDGRITKEDAEKASVQQTKPAAQAKPTTAAAPAVATQSGARDERREKMSSLRKTIAKRLVTVKNETAMLTTFNEVNMKPIMDLRAKYKETFKEKHGVGLGFMSFFSKAVCTALKEWPAVNARIEND